MDVPPIELRGVQVHNLQRIDVDIPRNQLVAVCGVSGSGKTSLALDTLYAEGQRRYVESFSVYTRQFLEQMEKPEADRISGIPASIAVTRGYARGSSRATVGTATELVDYLRLLFSRMAELRCPQCGNTVQRHSAASISMRVAELPQNIRFQVAFPVPIPAEGWTDESWSGSLQQLQEQGFLRILCHGRMYNFPDQPSEPDPAAMVVVDRLKTGEYAPKRLYDSLETALQHGLRQCSIFVDSELRDHRSSEQHDTESNSMRGATPHSVDGKIWYRLAFSQSLSCARCEIEFLVPEPKLFSFNSPWGACPTCEGFGRLLDLDMELVVPNPLKSLRDGAIAPWNSSEHRHELDSLLSIADDIGLPIDVPFRELAPQHRQVIRDGLSTGQFSGLKGFFAKLESHKSKAHAREMLNHYRSEIGCPTCQGQRLREASLCWRLGSRNIAEICAYPINQAIDFFASLPFSDKDRQVSRGILEQVRARLEFLREVGLEYLTLDRPLSTLSGGEMHRVSLTSALGSSLVNMLYVLDEPSAGLHPSDTGRLLQSLRRLRDRNNSVLVVEHDEEILRAADHIIEMGPGAGEQGGRLVFSGPPAELIATSASLTGDYLSGRRGRSVPTSRRPTQRGILQLKKARGNNLKCIDVDFPLGVLCVVTGVSGAGKSTLVQDTLYPALCRRKRKNAPAALPFDDIFGDGPLEDVVSIDQTPVGRSPRSNPVTYVKAFDAIRTVFSETIEARTRNISASAFSFNLDGGRCTGCQGDGYVQIDMQFLSDVMMRCSDCHGRRYRREILQITYRGKNIADVLDMSVREAISHFRGHEKVQDRLRPLIDVGLDYLRLGQPANTLAAGESQRLKLASYLSRSTRNRTLFLLDEPTTGLHFNDVVQLLDCFDALLNAGHSIIVVEHNLQLMMASDYIVDMGPGAAEAGGRVVRQGTPEVVAACNESITGRYLRREFERLATL
ncbi:MAG: excinuclease ABC subunit UvrA [Planctomycetota bacterium]|nr:excinuclease ABC subunit UvrA [Planctomycetota bacterium]